jgi:hypothetical protein
MILATDDRTAKLNLDAAKLSHVDQVHAAFARFPRSSIVQYLPPPRAFVR